MSAPSSPEVWLRGPLPGIDLVLMPAAHTLVQAREDIAATAAGASEADLWACPGADHLVAEAQAGSDLALVQLERTPPAAYGEIRPVDRAGLPATVLGLIVHAAEHTSRHVGQFITTLKIARGLRATPAP
jgi:hypothetical protein